VAKESAGLETKDQTPNYSSTMATKRTITLTHKAQQLEEEKKARDRRKRVARAKHDDSDGIDDNSDDHIDDFDGSDFDGSDLDEELDLEEDPGPSRDATGPKRRNIDKPKGKFEPKKQNIHKLVPTSALNFALPTKPKLRRKPERSSPVPNSNDSEDDVRAVNAKSDPFGGLEDGTVLTEKGQFDLVRQLFLNKDFPGSFSGIRNMQRQIFLARKIHIPINVVASALRSIPAYLMHLSPVRKFETGHFETTTIGENVQGLYYKYRKFIMYYKYRKFIILKSTNGVQ
jgi:hypothetical protein